MQDHTKKSMLGTRRRILQLLKVKGPLTADELSQELRMTSMGARGHLTALERDGLIEHHTQQRGMGRPSYVYSLTDQGDEIFPRTYPQLASSLLDALRALGGEEAIDRMFEKRTEWVEAQYRARMADKTLEERVKELARIRTEEGYMADWEVLDQDTFVLREHNCSICQIARQCAQACSFELELFRRVLEDAEVSREKHMIQGDLMCAYVMRRAKGARVPSKRRPPMAAKRN
ncbi:MAG: hypothetical protein A2Z21_06245 [Candidatus Fraserbacteria bacterium RBG_16_55_9]|uniref:Transcriptional regulator n=1 Tax=Fraserbacteria sp. (strain RBG_16_55_9) TaxID=1817864 RepID=A0A1F5UU15_FRAXR|nr:MAG: hypothetical protein A2Z21_06245 [Candidatus Fraserbacteria bacterium RBG_16_55_9]